MLQTLSYHSDHRFFRSPFFLSPLLYFSNSVSVQVSDMNQTIPIAFVVLFDNASFKAKFEFDDLPVETEAVAAAKETNEKTYFKVSWRKSALK